LTDFASNIYSTELAIKFTMEAEFSNAISFLDAQALASRDEFGIVSSLRYTGYPHIQEDTTSSVQTTHFSTNVPW